MTILKFVVCRYFINHQHTKLDIRSLNIMINDNMYAIQKLIQHKIEHLYCKKLYIQQW